MTVYSLENAQLGLRSERPDINDPTIPRHGSQPPTYVCIDTLDVFQDTGSAWLLVGRFGLTGLTPDGLTPGGILVAGNVDAASFTVGGRRLDFLSLVTVTDDYAVQATDHTILVAASGKTVTLPDPASVPADTELRIKNTPDGDTTTVEPPQIPPPATPGPSFTQSGGTVVDGVYTVAVTYTNALGETVASSSATVTAAGDPVADTSTLVIQSPDAETGATGWNAYLSQVGGSDLTLQNVTPTLIGTDLTLTAPPTSGGAAPPARSTASICAIDGVATYSLGAPKAAAAYISDSSNYSVL